jgi:hypothetical protein
MKKIIFMSLFLTACSSVPLYPEPKLVEQEMVIDKKIQTLSRNEVIVGVRECETNGLRKINGYTTDIVVDVTCAPKWKD